jgi:hypothetical protein
MNAVAAATLLAMLAFIASISARAFPRKTSSAGDEGPAAAVRRLP